MAMGGQTVEDGGMGDMPEEDEGMEEDKFLKMSMSNVNGISPADITGGMADTDLKEKNLDAMRTDILIRVR